MGCGGGATTTSGIPGGGSGGEIGGGGEVVTGPVGYITISMQPDGPAPNVPLATGGQATITGLRDHFRVVVKQVLDVEIIDEENNPYIVRTELRRIVQDNTIPGSVQIAVPPGDGYTVELLTYDQAGSINNMLQYGQSATFSIASGVNTLVPVTLNPVSQYVTITAPDNVVTGFAYSVSIGKTVPLRSPYYLSQLDNTASWPIPNFVAGYGTGIQRTATSVSFTAPAVTAQSNVYLQGQFFIDDSLLNASELAAGAAAWSNWRINCPDPAYTQSVRSILLLPGTIGVIIVP
jgi:hypothetical protein